MTDWLTHLSVVGMALLVFAACYGLAALVGWAVTRLGAEHRAAFKAISPGMLPPLGILFALLVGFISVEVWSNYDKAKNAVASEASALRAVVLLADSLAPEQRARINSLMNRHIEDAVTLEWPAMARREANLSVLPGALVEALRGVLGLRPANEAEQVARLEIIKALQSALEARRQRIIVSEAAVGWVKWAGIVLQGLSTLLAIGLIHSDNKRACSIALGLFATGMAVSIVLIAAYSRPFTGESAVGPELLKQVIASESAAGSP